MFGSPKTRDRIWRPRSETHPVDAPAVVPTFVQKPKRPHPPAPDLVTATTDAAISARQLRDLTKQRETLAATIADADARIVALDQQITTLKGERRPALARAGTGDTKTLDAVERRQATLTTERARTADIVDELRRQLAVVDAQLKAGHIAHLEALVVVDRLLLDADDARMHAAAQAFRTACEKRLLLMTTLREHRSHLGRLRDNFVPNFPFSVGQDVIDQRFAQLLTPADWRSIR